MTGAPVADIRDLRIGPVTGDRSIVDGVTLSVAAGEVQGVMGASGSGKTTLALSLLGHLRTGLTVRSGSVRVSGVDPFDTPGLRGRVVSYLGQDPMAALNPYRRIGSLIAEALRLRLPAAQAVDVAGLCGRVELPADRAFLRRFPHQVSGGQAQRVALAVALAGSPRLLVLDEPTSMLDTATADSIRRLLQGVLHGGATAGVVVSHNSWLVTALAHRIMIMSGGVMSEATLRQSRPRPRVTRGRRSGADQASPVGEPARLAVEDLSARHGRVGVLDRVSFSIPAGGCVALTGPSGSGKTTTARCVVGLHRPRAGRVLLDGIALAGENRKRSFAERRAVQFVAQDSAGALNPRETVRRALLRPLRGADTDFPELADVAELLERVRLPVKLADRHPGQLSGGERQRVNLARALAAHPRVLVCDEITSALDGNTASAVLDLLDELRFELGVSVLLVTHDVDLVGGRADEVLELSGGRARPAPERQTLSAAQQPARTVLRRVTSPARRHPR